MIATDAAAEPPGPAHTRVKTALAVSTPVLADPDVGRVPCQPPLAEQLVALLALHCSVVAPPAGTVVVSAVRFAVGAGEPLTGPGR